jgi:steroid 5-alpha reductase family enzyme
VVQPADDYLVGRGLAGASRGVSFAVVALAYLLGAAAAAAVVLAARSLHAIPLTLAADVVATVAVFAVSMAVANSSLYDPYWSVAPPVVAVAWALTGTGVGARQVLVVTLIVVWAVRLTVHWGGTWRGLGHEDWRYVELRERTRARLPWWLLSLVGIQLMPTLVVFLGLLSLWPAVAVGTRPLNLLDAAAVIVTGAAIAIEAVSDIQLRRFVADPANRGRTADRGLWRLSRHPNYLGEIAFWWGLWLFGLAAAPGWWWTIVGPLAMVVLFLTASIPLMDRRNLARRPDYGTWMRTVPALLPSPRRPAPRPGGIQ